MSAPACAFCTGTHYLADQPALGPCVCCEPDTMTALENLILELDEKLSELDGVSDNLADAAAHLRTYLVRQGFSSNPVTLADPDLWALCGLLF